MSKRSRVMVTLMVVGMVMLATGPRGSAAFAQGQPAPASPAPTG